MAAIRRTLNWFKVTWSEQPVLFAASVIGGIGPLIVLFSPLTDKQVKEMDNWPRYYVLSKAPPTDNSPSK